MNCYSCIHWQYFDEDSDTHEGYGYCRNPLSDSFGGKTDECDDGCSDGDTPNIDGSNHIKLNPKDSHLDPETFLVCVDKGDKPIGSARKWFVIKGSEFLNRSGKFTHYFQDELNPDEILFESKDQAIALWHSTKSTSRDR